MPGKISIASGAKLWCIAPACLAIRLTPDRSVTTPAAPDAEDRNDNRVAHPQPLGQNGARSEAALRRIGQHEVARADTLRGQGDFGNRLPGQRPIQEVGDFRRSHCGLQMHPRVTPCHGRDRQQPWHKAATPDHSRIPEPGADPAGFRAGKPARAVTPRAWESLDIGRKGSEPRGAFCR